jgi:hypothetical protein
MVTIILAIALLVALIGLGVEIGIASWSIRRANRYQLRKSLAECTAERAINERQDMARRMESLDAYALKVSWLLNFLYNRYDKFADLETEVNEGLKDISGDTPVGELDAKYKDLKKALKTIRVTVKASERMETLMDSIISQLSQIREDFQDEDDEKPESEKTVEDIKEKLPNPESAE